MAYAVESLVGILKHVLHPDHKHLNIVNSKPDEVQSLLKKASLLIDLSKESNIGLPLENRIRDAAYWAEDIIEIYISDQQMLPNPKSSLNLKDVMKEFDSINNEIVMITRIKADPPPTSLPLIVTSSSEDHDIVNVSYPAETDSKNNLVGLDGHLIHLKDQLIIGQQSTLQIIPIVGMKGMGKTTLARELYNYYLSSGHKDFASVAWVTVSQQYNAKKTLLAVLKCFEESNSKDNSKEMRNKSDEELEKLVKGKLRGRRYLFVVDNICNIETWGQIKGIFPDDQNGSRIMLTTRVLDVANYAAPATNIHRLHFMGLDESWRLLRQNVFVRGICPSSLEEIGVEIAKKCMGNPLVTSVVAALLATSKNRDFWNLVLEDISSVVVTEDNEHLLDLISVCYNHLPHHVKPCFIYFGGFQAEYEIRPSRIIGLWIAEGLIKPTAVRTLEESAEIYLRDLIARNLVAAHQQEHNSKLEFVRINGLLWELCQKKAADEKVFWFKDLEGRSIPQDTTVMSRITRHTMGIDDNMELSSFARSFLCTGNASLVLAPLLLGIRLLRVLDVYEIKFYQFPIEILELVRLRYLALTCHSTLPSSISIFWNLQTLIIRRLPSFRAFALPPEIWEMTQLRHIKSKEAGIWYRPSNVVDVQENMQTLSNVQTFGFTDDLLTKFPNLKKLGLFCDVAPNRNISLDLLNKLETLKCSSDWSPSTRNFLNCLTFPASLRKLTLRFCIISYDFLSRVGELPNLKQLKLQKCDFLGYDRTPTETDSEQTGAEWLPIEGEFLSLEFLLLEDLNLVHWDADSKHFPSLRHLVVRDCSSLKEIPFGIGDILTLELIEVDESNPSLAASAMLTQEEQREMGNEELKVVVHRS